MKSKLKKTSTHIAALVIGLLLARGCTKPQIKEVIKEVQVEVEKEVQVIKVKPIKIIERVYKTRYVKVPRQCPKHETRHVAIIKTAKNRFTGAVGYGPNELKSKYDGAFHFSVESGLVMGIGYSRMIDEQLSLGVFGTTNGTYLGTVGVDF